jgi:Zn-dependent protease
MLRSWKLGRAFGIPLFVHPSFLLIILWVAFQTRGMGVFIALFELTLVLSVFSCVVLHELGHALMARRFGIRTLDITLYPIGGVARLARLTERPVEELCIALAGPAVNVVIAILLTPLLFFGLFSGVPLITVDKLTAADGIQAILFAFMFCVWVSNIVLVLFNLIPAFPMDGGRVLRALLANWLGRVVATDVAARLGLVLAVMLGCFALLRGDPALFLISIFVAFVGHQERLMIRYYEAQRRAAAASEPVVSATRGFSGVAWDGRYRVWVRWVDGRPVGYYSPTE